MFFLVSVKVSRDPIGFFAEKLDESMDGPGTEDDVLIRIVVSRSEVL